MGRPLKPINEATVRSLARIHCTYEEMGHVIGVHPDTLHDRFSETINEARSGGKMSLRRWQFKKAKDGNVAMLIWLGKQFLNQMDKLETTMAPEEITPPVYRTIQHSILESTREVKKQLREDKANGS